MDNFFVKIKPKFINSLIPSLPFSCPSTFSGSLEIFWTYISHSYFFADFSHGAGLKKWKNKYFEISIFWSFSQVKWMKKCPNITKKKSSLPWIVTSKYKFPNNKSWFSCLWVILYNFVNAIISHSSIWSIFWMFFKFVRSTHTNRFAFLPICWFISFFIVKFCITTNCYGSIWFGECLIKWLLSCSLVSAKITSSRS